MSSLPIRKVAVLGAGVMGAQIAAHLINAKVPVVLFDLPAKEGSKSSIALKAIETLKKLRPAPLALNELSAWITAANYEEHLDQLSTCDLVIEAIAERMDWKLGLYQKISGALAPHAIFASNTSGLSIRALSQGFSAELQQRFCGVHFFNPPRYMHLVELIPTPATRPEILDQLETFLTTTLGKGVVRAYDTPNFIANRVGIFSMLATLVEAEKFGLPYDVVDDLTGSKFGRAKSATFRTADVVGLDTLLHVIETMRDTLPLAQDSFASLYAPPPVLTGLVTQGLLGQKSGAGFYRKEGKTIKVLQSLSPEGIPEYVASQGKADDLIARILKKKNPAERLTLLHDTDHPQAQFLWAIYRDVFHYIAIHLQDIAPCARDIDFALRWGFGWSEGPFETWQAAGWSTIAQWIAEDIAAGKALSTQPLPAWVSAGRTGVHDSRGSYAPTTQKNLPRSTLPVYQQQIFRAPLYGESRANDSQDSVTVQENNGVRIWHLAQKEFQDVLILSLKSKMHTLGSEQLAGIVEAIEIAERDYRALVIWSPDEPFSAGANLEAMLPAFMQHGIAGVEVLVAQFQQTLMRVKYAHIPVVGAAHGLALGGGCELLMSCAKRVAHLEAYIGLVEVGVGLLPAGGGLKEMALRASREAKGGDLLPFIKAYFTQAAMATVSKSAHEAQQLGYLSATDPLVFNTYNLLGVALHEAQTLAMSGYRPPLRAQHIVVAGRSVCATLQGHLVNLRDGGFISAHDYKISRMIANVLCGGDVEAGSMVDEQWLLDLERQSFCALATDPKTQERIMGMLQTGKPVRN